MTIFPAGIWGRGLVFVHLFGWLLLLLLILFLFLAFFGGKVAGAKGGYEGTSLNTINNTFFSSNPEAAFQCYLSSSIVVLYESYKAHAMLRHLALFPDTLPHLSICSPCSIVCIPCGSAHSFLCTLCIWQGFELELSNHFGSNNLVLICISTDLNTCWFHVYLCLFFIS